MRERTPEPGFVQAYRLFVMIRILFWLAVGPVLVLIELAGNPGLSPDQVASQPWFSSWRSPTSRRCSSSICCFWGCYPGRRPPSAWAAGSCR